MSTGSIEPSPSPSPGSLGTMSMPNGVPKMGTLVPNRVFVGGISSTTTETELHQLFSEFGNVKQTKIIADRAGVSKGYGFVTFETEEEARRLQAASEDIVLKERKLNIAPAIKKQQSYGRSYEMGQPVVNGALYYHNGIPYTYQQNGVAVFVSDGVTGVVSPTNGKGGNTPTTPFSLVYPSPGGGTTMFLPSPTAAAVSQQQLQLQAAIRDAAVQSQSPGSGNSTPGSTPSAAWRWISPQTTSATGTTGGGGGGAGSSQPPAVNGVGGVGGGGQSTPGGQQLNQTAAALSYAQDSVSCAGATTSSTTATTYHNSNIPDGGKVVVEEEVDGEGEGTWQENTPPQGLIQQQPQPPPLIQPPQQFIYVGHQPIVSGPAAAANPVQQQQQQQSYYMVQDPSQLPGIITANPGTNQPQHLHLDQHHHPQYYQQNMDGTVYEFPPNVHQNLTTSTSTSTTNHQHHNHHPHLASAGTVPPPAFYVPQPVLGLPPGPLVSMAGPGSGFSTPVKCSTSESQVDVSTASSSQSIPAMNGLKNGEGNSDMEGGSCYSCNSNSNNMSITSNNTSDHETVNRGVENHPYVFPTASELHETNPAVPLTSHAMAIAAPYTNFYPPLQYFAMGRPGEGLVQGQEGETAKFVFPAPNQLPPLTPMTPSVDPATGFKTGYTVPQTPNIMTNNQFYQMCQGTSGYYFPHYYNIVDQEPEHCEPVGQPCPPAASPAQSPAKFHLSQPPTGKSGHVKSSEQRRFTELRKDSAGDNCGTRGEDFPSGGEGGYDRRQSYQPTGYIDSPFKKFTKFTGSPTPNVFPMRPNFVNSCGIGYRSFSTSASRPGIRYFGGGGSRGNPLASPMKAGYAGRASRGGGFNRRNTSSTNSGGGEAAKGSWYKQGARFGQRNQLQSQAKVEADKLVKRQKLGSSGEERTELMTSEGSSGLMNSVAATTPPATPTHSPGVVVGPEPDLLQGQMKMLAL